jgi:NADH-quinone oxidoreductase subunit L
MEGPTPVSALIHAATMVTAGVYMVARSSPLYTLAPTSLSLVATVGALTALFAATIACVQTDIKRVIAYSTISQLGYMFLGAGVGAFASGIFHLVTHAFFKALLFLGAGVVIHALHGEQDLRRMGGLRHPLTLTAYTFLVGAAANAGVFPLAGFWSKDEILFAVFTTGHYGLWVLGLVGAFLTAFYMTRLYCLTFEGPFRGGPTTPRHLHDAPPNMALPLLVLALGAVGVGWLVGYPPEHGAIHQFLAPSLVEGLAPSLTAGPEAAGHASPWLLAGLSLAAAGAGIGAGALLYLRWRDVPELLAARFQPVYRLLWNKYYVDELYWDWIAGPLMRLSTFLWRGFDVTIVDGAVDGVARLLERGSFGVRRLQTGVVFNYVLSILAGAVLLLGYLVLRR